MRTRPTIPALFLSLAVAAALALLAWAAPAHGGGFSVTTLDPLPAAARAGTTLAVGYTVLAHGVTPVRTDRSGIAIVAADGTRTVFPGRPRGPLGHYVAEVRFPSPGRWRWQADESGFTMQDLGSVTVAPAPPASAPAGDRPGAVAWALLAAPRAAAALLAGQAIALARRRPRRGLGPEP